jgi:serine/threonine-protein kinase
MTFQLGKTYGDYQFIDVLESSRFGVVYRVRNLAENRFEMLRELPASLREDPERVERFLREAKLRARLTHRNIVALYRTGVLEGQYMMTTEAVEGRTLAERLELGPMEASEAVETAIQALDALSCAHERGVMHREVTAGNLLITPEGAVKLTGFSIARGVQDPKLTQMGAAMGEVHYMSPEQVRGVSEPDARSDLYSMGVVLYEMLTGKRPFTSDSQFEIMSAHVNTPPAPPSRLNPRIPAELDAVVLRALAKDPAGRFQSAAEFRERLQAPRLMEEAEARAPAAWPVQVCPAPAAVSATRQEGETVGAAARDRARGAPSSDLPEMRLGVREVVVLSMGVVVMVLAMAALTR